MERTTGAVQVLDRSVAVLHVCEEGPATLAELVRRTGLARATAHRLACAMEAHGLLRREDDGRWVLGPTVARMGAVAAEGPSLAVIARPALETLRDASGESTQLFVRRGDERLCIVSLESPHSLRTIVPVGAALPIDRGSAGRVLREPATRRGWVATVEEREPGVASVSAPVRDHRPGAGGKIVAAVSVSGPVERTSRSPGSRYGPLVVAAAAEIEGAARLTAGVGDGHR